MARAKRHRKRVKYINGAPELSGDELVRINIKTGEGFCKIRELWENERLDRLPDNDKEAS